jgi:peptidoglycan/LPS O-acetylase OafA/YrhL
MKDIDIKKYDYIDAIRGFAIMGVVLVHSSQWIAPQSGFLLTVSANGQTGVQLFFIASALTLFLSIESRQKQQEEKYIIKFFIRRFFRIAPAFYLAIFAYVMYEGFSPRYWAPNGIEWWYVILTFFFLHGWHPETINSVVPGGWSIAVEMMFYLFVPYIFSKLNGIRITLFAIFVSLIFSKAISTAIIYLLSSYYSANQKYIVSSFGLMWFPSQFPIFLLGILLYHIIKKYPYQNKQTALFLLSLSLFLFISFLTVSTNHSLLPKHFLTGIAFVVFSLSLHYYPWTLLVNNFTILVGRLSFSIYLTHFMVINLLSRVYDKFNYGFVVEGNIGFILAFSVVMCLSICISYITYNIVESSGIKLGKYIARKV